MNPTTTQLATSFLQKAGYLVLLLLLSVSFPGFAQNVQGPDYLYVDISKNPTNGANTTYGAQGGGSPSFDNANLGIYTIGKSGGQPDDMLLFQGGQLVTTEPTQANASFKSAQLYYRVFPRNNAGTTTYTPLALTDVSDVVSGSTTTRTFQLTNAAVDLISSVSAAGQFTVDVYLQANYVTTNADGTTTTTVKNDNNGGFDYQAVFTVTGARTNTTIWNGKVSDNWFDSQNWSNGTPSSTVNAFIPYPGSGSQTQYPKIYANGAYQMSTTSNPSYPYTGQAYGNAVTRSLSFGGNSSTTKASVELASGNLLVYGDFTGDYNNFIQDAGTAANPTVITFAGTGSQSLSMASTGNFQTVNIAGGGTKTLSGNMNVFTELHFGSTLSGVSGTGLLTATGAGNLVTLQTSTSPSAAARLTNETDNGYVLGTVTTTVLTIPGSPQDFGGMGLTLQFTGNAPGLVAVSRTTGQNFSAANTTASKQFSIKRSFQVNPQYPNTSGGGTGLSASLIFNYLDADRMNVGPNSTTIDESRLYLAVSNNATSFTSLGYTTRSGATNTLTKDVVTTFGVFTLADENNPLPVSLVAFDAKRLGSNTLITWATASETDNLGFDVEVSTDGTYFRTLGFIASASPNSLTRLSYSFTDAEAGKSGVRYYRLHQRDLNGKDDYSAVRAVSFAATGDLATALSAYPNPFSGDQLKLALQSTTAGTASLRLTDLLGREIANQTFSAVSGVTEVTIDQAVQLTAGSYMAQITTPSGEIKTVRIQKQ